MEKKYELNLEKIGPRLREVRNALNKTIDAMHEISGFSKSLISSAEKGLKKPSTIYLTMLLELFNVNVNYVLSGRGPMFVEGAKPDTKGSDIYLELLWQMENQDIVKHTMIAQYLIFKANNGELLSKISKGEDAV